MAVITLVGIPDLEPEGGLGLAERLHREQALHLRLVDSVQAAVDEHTADSLKHNNRANISHISIWAR